MQFKLLSLVALLSVAVSAQNLTSVLTSDPQLSNLTSYVQLFPDLLQQLAQATNITILAPSNEAFNKLMSSSAGAAIQANDTAAIQALLSYHVLSGIYPASSIGSTPAFVPSLLNNPRFSSVTGGQKVEAVKKGDTVTFTSGLRMTSNVTKADLNFTGGVIHVINNVLTVPQNISSTAVAANLTAVAGALESAGLVEALDTGKDLTIFAPNNEAFQRIGSALPNLTTQQLAQILAYHVVNGTVAYSSTLMNQTVRSENGQELRITVAGGSVFVNSAKVVLADVLVANGVVHVIDNVLNPNMTNALPNPSQSTQSVAYSGASSTTAVPFTSGVPTASSTVGGAMNPTASSQSSASSSTSSAAAAPMKTGGMGMAALLGAGAAMILV
ncbi:MAG: hypothetical protein M1816_007339 [Peltula sp. TS41687]|nr:MAG: hypothetical protein M1816_007339 [Peltula sp. TS41687]